MMKTPEIRERVRAAVWILHEVDNRLAELAESLPLPPDAAQMWDSRVPASFTANLYAALDAVRSDCIQDAIATLLYAARQSEDSLRREWAAVEPKAAYPPSANDNNTPAASAGREETPQC
jgi:hypothetical protein